MPPRGFAATPAAPPLFPTSDSEGKAIMAERKRRPRLDQEDATNRELGDIVDRATVAEADMNQQEPNPEHENINPSQPVTPEKPV